MIPGEIVTADGAIELTPRRDRIALTVENAGDRPIQVGSHYHFAQTNPALSFDRAAARGACPHTAIRDDITANLDAVEALEHDHPNLDLVLVESGGDNLTATFSYGLVHRQIFVIDVAGGDKVPRKGGPGVTRSDLLVINKIDLASLVGADLEVMRRDAAAARGTRPTLFTSLTREPSAPEVAEWTRSVHRALVPRRS